MRVAVLQGGPSAEAEVSRSSAKEVAAALREAGHDARCVELDRSLTANLSHFAPDVVFPALHGPPGEDGTVQGYLTMLSLPYVGSGVEASALAMNKAVSKMLFARHGLPLADGLVVTANDDPDAAARRVHEELGDRVVVKPLSEGSALGVTLLPNGGDVAEAIRGSQRYGDLLIEVFKTGREITCGVLDVHGSEPIAHPVIEITTATDQWYDFHNRYAAGASEHLIPAPLPDEVIAEVTRVSVAAHQVLGLRDLSRADLIVDDLGGITLLEVNTLPGMTPTSLYPDGAKILGYDFPGLLDALVRSAQRRGCDIALNGNAAPQAID